VKPKQNEKPYIRCHGLSNGPLAREDLVSQMVGDLVVTKDGLLIDGPDVTRSFTRQGNNHLSNT
jgi:hypothetical protein